MWWSRPYLRTSRDEVLTGNRFLGKTWYNWLNNVHHFAADRGAMDLQPRYRLTALSLAALTQVDYIYCDAQPSQEAFRIRPIWGLAGWNLSAGPIPIQWRVGIGAGLAGATTWSTTYEDNVFPEPQAGRERMVQFNYPLGQAASTVNIPRLDVVRGSLQEHKQLLSAIAFNLRVYRIQAQQITQGGGGVLAYYLGCSVWGSIQEAQQ